MFSIFHRMFCSPGEYLKANENGEFEVARGVSGNVFKIILVCIYNSL